MYLSCQGYSCSGPWGPDSAIVPVRHEIHPVRVDRHEQQDHVVQDPHRLRVGPAGRLVGDLEEVLRGDALGDMSESAVDPDHRLALCRQLLRLFVGQPLGVREPLGDVLVVGEVLLVLGRG